MMSKVTVLVLQDYFLPGYKGGGSLRTVANLVTRLSGDFDFAVLTRDRDKSDTEAYQGLTPGWTQHEHYRVRYLAPKEITPWGLVRAARSVDYDLLYCNSFFSTLTVLLLSAGRAGLLPDRTTVLAPRGELAEGALALKSTKKELYIRCARALGLLRGVRWHASSHREAAEIRRLFDGPIAIGMDLCDPSRPLPTESCLPKKSPGSVRFVFLSRLDRKKNLTRALELVSELEGDVVFDIYGTVEDPAYWQECSQLIGELPTNVRCIFCGPAPHKTVSSILSRYHFLLFPTRNENFGHVILEALAAALPVIISDQTPWTDLKSRGVGFDQPLDDDGQFRNVLRECVAMGPEEHQQMSKQALELARSFIADEAPLADTRRLFLEAMECGDR